MSDPRGTMPTIYEDKQEMINGLNGGGKGSRQLVLVQPTRVEEGIEGMVLATTYILRGMPMQPLQLFDGR